MEQIPERLYLLGVIGAGEGGYPILKKAKEMPFVKTLAFGQAGSIAKDHADFFVECDINDISYIVKVCHDRKVDGVIGTSESTTEATAIIANCLGLPGNDVSNGFGARSKLEMRKRVAAVGCVQQPRFELYEPGKNYNLPIVIKALDSCGKRGISVVRNRTELLSAVEYAATFSTGGAVLVEEYLDGGKEFSIECLVGAGYYEIVQYTEKESSGPPHFVETGHHQPAHLSEEVRIKIDKAVPEILKALGIRCGLAHLELKVINDEVFFIELGARGGGDHIADTLTVESTDFDYFKAAIDSCLGLYKHQEIHTVAHTGIYFHCNQNKHLAPLFKAAKTADWCIADTTTCGDFSQAESNVETAQSGYIIYRSNHKITLKDA